MSLSIWNRCSCIGNGISTTTNENKTISIMIFSMILDKARQRASVKWILSKAYNNRVPEDLREPFYRDHEGQDHLKPKVFLTILMNCQQIWLFLFPLIHQFDLLIRFRLWKDWEMHRYTAKHCQIFTQTQTTKISTTGLYCRHYRVKVLRSLKIQICR